MILVGPSRIHGQGAFAVKDFDEGQQIGVYEGKRYSARQVSRRSWATGLTYVFGLSDGSVIDAAVGGNSTRHLNHSCAPNWRSARRDRAERQDPRRVLRAARDPRR